MCAKIVLWTVRPGFASASSSVLALCRGCEAEAAESQARTITQRQLQAEAGAVPDPGTNPHRSAGRQRQFPHDRQSIAAPRLGIAVSCLWWRSRTRKYESDGRRRIPFPGVRYAQHQRTPAGSIAVLQARWSIVPPRGIASIALRTRFSRMRSNSGSRSAIVSAWATVLISTWIWLARHVPEQRLSCFDRAARSSVVGAEATVSIFQTRSFAAPDSQSAPNPAATSTSP